MGHEQLVQRIFDEVINRGDVDAADELFTEDFVDHGPGGDLHGVPAFKDVVRAWLAAAPDVHCAVAGVISDGARVAWLVRTTGTHTGDFTGIPASGRRFETVSANYAIVRDGRAAEHWAEQGMLQFMAQVGATPAPA
jgi:steroid delta-isomerase-like uncharacterized protein